MDLSLLLSDGAVLGEVYDTTGYKPVTL